LKEREKIIPNVIFLDINMPQMNGWQCLSALKSDPATKEIPVIIYSTSSHERDKQIAMELGASGFITKPSNYHSLRSILTSIAGNLHSDISRTIKSL
jgi:CheY-like chemotaxis protein